jgi:hypothetical protein
MPTTVEQERAATRRRTGIARVDAGEADIAQSAVALVRTGQATIGQSMVGAVVASGDVSLSKGAGRTFLAGRDLHLRQGGGGFMVAGGDAEIREGGVGTMVALGSVRIDQGGALLALAKHVDAREGTTVGLALSPRIVMAPGARVLAGWREVVAGGAIAGLVIGVVLSALRRIGGR